MQFVLWIYRVPHRPIYMGAHNHMWTIGLLNGLIMTLLVTTTRPPSPKQIDSLACWAADPTKAPQIQVCAPAWQRCQLRLCRCQ